MCYRTLEQWNARGRQVKKGEKAAGRLNDNTPLFGKSQTKKMPKQYQTASYTHHTERTVTNWGQSLDWDECHEFGLDIGLPGQWWDSNFISIAQWVGQAHFFSTPHPLLETSVLSLIHRHLAPQISSTSHTEFYPMHYHCQTSFWLLPPPSPHNKTRAALCAGSLPEISLQD